MTDLPASIAAESALLRQNVTLSVIKQNSEQAEALAGILDKAVRSAPVSGSKGVNLNTSA